MRARMAGGDCRNLFEVGIDFHVYLRLTRGRANRWALGRNLFEIEDFKVERITDARRRVLTENDHRAGCPAGRPSWPCHLG